MLYVKRWAPEDWPLAFQGQVHLLSSADYALVEGEMRRVILRRATRREQPPRRPRDGIWAPVAPRPLVPGDRNGPSRAQGDVASTSPRGAV